MGERVLLVNGAGGWAEAELVGERGRDRAVLRTRQVGVAPDFDTRLIVVQAICKTDATDLAVDLLTQVGADVIVPWQAERCVRRWDAERAAKGRTRWQRIATEAAKQSRRARFPHIAEPATTRQLSQRIGRDCNVLVCHEQAKKSIVDADIRSGTDVVLVIGPEGGITDGELDVLVGLGGQIVGLGPTVLQASSAGLAASAITLQRLGRWQSADPRARP